MNKAVFLDRDGVINEMVYHKEFGILDSPANPDEFKLMPEAGESVARLNRAGFKVIVVSNQPGIAKGKYTLKILKEINKKMIRELKNFGAKLDGIYYCLHHPQAKKKKYKIICNCRKPKPELVFKAAREFEVDLPSSYMIGDGIIDIEAGRASGVKTILLANPKLDLMSFLKEKDVNPDHILRNLPEAVQFILS